jgi:putative transposase
MEKTTAMIERRPFPGEDWFDPLEMAVRGRIRGFIEEMLEAELESALQRGRYDRHGPRRGHRHGHRARQLVGTFGPVTLSVPRARLAGADGRTSEWRNQTIPTYRRLTKRAEALIAGAYLSGTNTRRVRRALGALFGGAIPGNCGPGGQLDRLHPAIMPARWRHFHTHALPTPAATPTRQGPYSPRLPATSCVRRA